MAFEYKIRFKSQDPENLDDLLRSVPHFAEFDAEWKTYNYRLSNNPGSMPNASIRIEEDGLYLCDYLMPSDMMNQLITTIEFTCDKVTVEDYDT